MKCESHSPGAKQDRTFLPSLVPSLVPFLVPFLGLDMLNKEEAGTVFKTHDGFVVLT